MKSGLVRPTYVYVLQLEDSCWYVGLTEHIQRRIMQHRKGNTTGNSKGAAWTRAHKVIDIVLCIIAEFEDAESLEKVITYRFAQLYGLSKVRGASYCRVNHLLDERWIGNSYSQVLLRLLTD